MPTGKEIFANKSANGLDNINADYVDVLHDLTVHGETILDGNLTVGGAISSAAPAIVTGSSNSYLGSTIQNTNAGNAAAAVVHVENDTGDDGYFGITSSGNTGIHGIKRAFVEGPGIDISTTGGASKTVRFTTNDVVRATIGDTELTSTVPITIPADPTTDSQVANKNYVDDTTAGLNAISALTGDVTATGPGSVVATVQAIQGSTITLTTPSTDQILSHNGTAFVNQSTNGSGNVVRTNAPTFTGVPLLSTASATTLGITQPTGNTLNVLSTGTSVSTTTGAATIAGGLGIDDNLFVRNKVTITSTTGNTLNVLSTGTSASTTTGAATIAGGLGINDNLNVLNGISGRTLTSTVADGTAPLNVTSTTKVDNLHVNRATLSDTVTTNANLTGPITSVGNATSIASQTGTGSTFVMSNTPTLVTPLLGTPTSGDLSNCTGTASGLTSGNVTNSSVDFAGAPFTTGGVVTASDTNTVTSTTAGTAGQILVSNGTGVAPTFQFSGAALPDFANFSTTSSVTFTTSPANATAGENYKSVTTYLFYLTEVPGSLPNTNDIYASQDTYTFVLSPNGSAVIGSVYSNNGNQFIVVDTVSSSASIIMYGLGFAFPEVSGTLTKVSGNGDATLDFSSQSITTPGHNYVVDTYDILLNLLYLKSAYDPIEVGGILNKFSGAGPQTIPYDGFARPESYYFEVSSTIVGGTTLNTIGSGVPPDTGYLVKESLGSGDDVITYSARAITALQLTASSPTTIYSSVTKQFNLPDATTLQPGRSFVFVGAFNVVFGNNAQVSIYNYGDTAYLIPLYTFPNTNDALFRATLLTNSTSVGKWAFTYEAAGSRGAVAYDIDLDTVSTALDAAKKVYDIYNAQNDATLLTTITQVASTAASVVSIFSILNTPSLLTNTVVLWDGSKYISLDGTEDGSLLTYKSSPDAPQYGGKAVITDSTSSDVILGISNNFSGTCDALVAKAPNITAGDSVTSYFGQGISNKNCLEVKYTHYDTNSPSNIAQLIMGGTELSLFADHIQMVNTGTESLKVENDSTSGNIDLAQFYMPNMSAADNVNLKIGKNSGNGNYTSTRFHYISDDSTSNYAIWSTGLLDHTAITLNNTLNPSITMTGATTINNANSGFDSLAVVNSAVDTTIENSAFMNPNLPGGVANIRIGVNANTNNHGKIVFTYGSSGSVANSLSTEMGSSRIEQFASGANTVTGATQINNVTGSIDSLVVTNQETGAMTIEMASLMAPNINAANVSTIKFGRNLVGNNYVTQAFQYAGSGLPSNAFYTLIGSSEILLEASGVHTYSGTGFNALNNALATLGTVNLKVGKNAGALNAANYGYVHQAGDGNGYNHALLGVSGYEALRLSALAGVSPSGAQVMGDFNTGSLYTSIATNSTSKYTGGVIVKSRYTFTITADTVVFGDVYTNNGQFFYAIATSAGTTMVTSGINDPTSPGGVLTKVQGTGAASITYSAYTVSEGGLGVQGPVYANHINAANDDGGGAPLVATFYGRAIATGETALMRFGKGTAGDDYAQFAYYVDSVTNSIMSITNGNSSIGFGRTSGSYLSSIPSSGLTAFTINNSISSAENVYVLDTMAPSLQAGFNTVKQFGKNVTTGNKVTENFFYNGSGDVGNYYRIAMDNGAEIILNNAVIPQVATLGQLSVTNSVQTTPTLKASNLNSGAGDIEVAEFTASNLVDGNFVNFKFGKNTSTGNHGDIEFFSNGNNDASNRFTFGLGSAGLSVNNAGENSLSGKTTVTASGTSALVVNNNATGVVDVGEFYQPNMVVTDASSILLGKNNISGNHTQLSFTYNADSTNHAALTCGSSDFTLSSGGLSVLTSSLLSTPAQISQATANTTTATLASFTAPSMGGGNDMKLILGRDASAHSWTEIVHHADTVDTTNNYATIGLKDDTPAIKINVTSLKLQQPVDFPDASYTANGVAYASTTTRIASTAAGTTGQVLTATTGGAPSWQNPAGTGTVTSVAMSVPTQFAISGTPITSSGTLGLSLSSTTGTAGTAIVLATSPNLVTPNIGAATGTSLNVTGNVTSTTGTVSNASSASYVLIDSIVAPNLPNAGKVASTIGKDTSTNSWQMMYEYNSGTPGNSKLIFGIPSVADYVSFEQNKITANGHCTFGNLSPTQQIFTSGSGTYTTPANVKYIIITLVGGGSGGCGCVTAGSAGGGGGGGGWAKHKIGSPAASYSYAVGAGGAGGTGANTGTAGGNTTFDGSTYIATGGGASATIYSGGAGGGTQTGASIGGGGGSGGVVVSMGGGATGSNYSGYGGSSYFGGETIGIRDVQDSNGTTGVSVGCGGSGAATNVIATTRNGGSGANGIILVDEYYI